MRRTDRRQAEDPALPGCIRKKAASVEAAHTVADHVNGFIGKRFEDLIAEMDSAPFDAGDRGNSRNEHTVSGLDHLPRNRAKVGRERDGADANSGEAE
jgi:hypothetical protein